MLKIRIHADFKLRSFFLEKTPAKAIETAASMPPKAGDNVAKLNTGSKHLYSLISLEEYKGILGVDDRDDSLSRFCLTTATFTIEQFCKRRLLRKIHTGYHINAGDHIFTLREYPVRKIISVSSLLRY